MENAPPRKPNEGSYQSVAPYYDLIAPKNQHDFMRFFHFAAKRHGGRSIRDVLEFACGTGRIAAPLAQEGYRVVGTDASQPMLDICRKKAEALRLSFELRHEFMQEFAEVDRYDALVAVFGAVAFLVEDSAIERFLLACKAGLRPGGFLLLDVPNGLEGLVKPWSGTSAETFTGDGVILDRFLQQIPDTLNGTTRYRDTGLIRIGDSIDSYQEEFTLRIFNWHLLNQFATGAGFRQTTCYCNWTDREPMQPPYSRLILVMEK